MYIADGDIRRTELDIRNIQRIEAGELNVLITTVRRLKEALRCDWDSLFG
ncbi:MAG: hypothetical protein ACXWJB_00195 [Limisphaerales bacterium]